MSDVDRGQVTASAAEIYDSFFVPALFQQWTAVVLDAAEVHPGDRVLDVGCGTGILARAAHERTAPLGKVAAVDPNVGMLEVARSSHPGIQWEEGVGESLSFADGAFDRTVSQFALMFFTDPRSALDEMARVTRPDGRIALAVWDRLEDNVGYARLARLIEQLFGATAGRALSAPFVLGDADRLADLVAHALSRPRVTSHRGTARFASLESWLHTEIRGWTLADAIDDDGFDALLELARRELGDLVGDHGVAFDVSALIVSGVPGH